MAQQEEASNHSCEADFRMPPQDTLALQPLPSWEEALGRLQANSGMTRRLAEVALLRHAGISETGTATRLGIGYHAVRGRVRRLYHQFHLSGEVMLVLLVERCLRQKVR